MKWLITLILISFSVTSGQINIDEYLNLRNRIQQGDTVKITDLVKNRMLIMMLLFSLPANGQVNIIGGKGYVPVVSDNTAPSIPSWIEVTPLDVDQIFLDWNPSPENDISKYFIYQDDILIDSTNLTSYTATSLSTNTQYCFKLKVDDLLNNYSALGSELCATTYDNEVDPGVPPVIPTSLTVTDSIDAITLTWVNNPPNAERIIIQREQADYDTVLFPTATWTDPNPLEGVYYPYRVYAENNGGSSDTTSEVTTELVRNKTIYFSNNGDNSNSGTNPNATVLHTKFNTIYWSPGDRAVFNAADTFQNVSLLLSYSGTAGNRITLDKYGSGDKPVITQRKVLPNWQTATWNHVRDSVYSSYLGSFSYQIHRIWINGVEYLQTKGLNQEHHSTEYPTGDGTSDGVNYLHRIYHNNSNDSVYLYSSSAQDPATYYSGQVIEYPGGDATLTLNGCDYVTVRNLDLQGSHYTFRYKGTDSLITEYCNIGKYAGTSAVSGLVSLSTSDQVSDNVIFRYNVIDSDLELVDWEDNNETVSYGFQLVGLNEGRFYQNYIKNWKFGFLPMSNMYPLSDVMIYENEFEGPDIGYGKPIQVGSDGDATMMSGIYIINNYWHDFKVYVQLTSTMVIGINDCYYGFNIHDSSYQVQNVHTSEGNMYGIYTDNSFDTLYIFNNTIDYCYGIVINNSASSSGRDVRFYNNMFTEGAWSLAKTYKVVGSEKTGSSRGQWKNNILWYPGKTSSYGNFWYEWNISTYYTTAQWNVKTGNADNTVFEGTRGEIYGSNYAPGTSAPQTSAGIALTTKMKNALLKVYPAGFYRRDGTLIVQSDSTQVNTDCGAGAIGETLAP